jgi:hypothetical protein
MKKQLLHISFIISLALTNVAGFSQIFKGEAIVGMNLSQVNGDEAYGYDKAGFQGGVGIVAPLYKNWSLSLETLYSQKGSKQKPQFNDSLDGSYSLKLDYAVVPLMIQYTDKENVSAGVGVSWGRLVNVDEFKNGYRVDSVTLQSKVFDRDDWSAFGDVRIRVYKNLIANLRYEHSFDKIATRTVVDSQTGDPNERDFYNVLWSFRLIYMINEKRSDKKEPKRAPINE